MKKIESDRTFRRHFLIKALGITTLAFLMLVNIVGATPFAYVINQDLPSGINVIDTATNKVVSYVDGDVSGPGVTVNPAGTKVYVTNLDKNTVSVIDTAAKKVTVTVKVGNDPYGVAVSPDGKKVYVANSGSNTVSVIDAAKNKVTTTVKVGNGPSGVAVNPAGTKVYVTNSDKNTVSVIDTATNKVTATVNVGNNPYGVAVNPAGTRIYVANSGSNTISVIDTKTNKVTATVELGNYHDGVALSPNEVAITPDGKKVYVACSGTYDNCFVPVIDTSTNKVITNISDGAYYDVGIAITPDGKKVYVINRGHTGAGYGVSVIDTATNKVTDYVDSGEYLLIPEAFGQFIDPSITPKPIAAFSASPTSGKVPLTIKFTDKSTGSPTSWSWNFGDKTISTAQNPTHKYTKAGKYTVSLTVKNAKGSSTKTVSNYITVKSK